MSQVDRRFYFGGSFNPPHRGHFQIIQYVLESQDSCVLHLVPTGKNPFKEKSSQSEFYLDSWLQDLENLLGEKLFSRIILEDEELKSSENSYTVETLLKLKERYPSAEWNLLLGSDLLEGLPRWKEVEKLLRALKELWLFERQGYECVFPEELNQFCKLHKPTLLLPNVSSTELRLLLEKEALSQEEVEFLKKNLSPCVWRLCQR